MTSGPDPPGPDALPRPSRLRQIGGFVLLFGLAFGVSGTVWYFHADHEPPEHVGAVEHASIPPAPHATAPVATNDEDVLTRADRLLSEGQSSTALASYRQMLHDHKGAPPHELHFRVALCQEALGNDESAQAAYQAVLGTNAAAPRVPVVQLALARLFLQQQKIDQAKPLLASFLFRAERATLPPGLLDEARYLLALAHAREVAPTATPEVAGCRRIEAALPALEIARMLEPLPTPEAAPPETKEILSIEVNPAGSAKTVLRVRLPLQPAVELLERLAQTGGLRLDWTPAARQLVQDRTLSLVAEQWRLTDLLDNLADHLGLCGQLDETTLRLTSVTECPREPLAAYRLRLARNDLEAVLHHAGKHRWMPTALLALGNLESSAGKASEARLAYERLLREAATSPLALHANFNLGLLLTSRGEHPAARKALYRAIDLAPAQVLAGRAYLVIGRTFLEEDDPRHAPAPLRRAQTLLRGSSDEPYLFLHLTAAHLLGNNPAAARQLLVEQRRRLHADPFKPTAILLEALAQYRLTRGKGALPREASDLLKSLLEERVSALGPLGLHLRGLAYQELGLWEEAALHYEKARAEAAGPLVAAMMFAQSQAQMRAGRLTEARTLLDTLVTRNDDRWGPPAQFQRAALALQTGQAQECTQHCQHLWHSQRWTRPQELLELWGRAHEQLGNHENAARCFAGEPAE